MTGGCVACGWRGLAICYPPWQRGEPAWMPPEPAVTCDAWPRCPCYPVVPLIGRARVGDAEALGRTVEAAAPPLEKSCGVAMDIVRYARKQQSEGSAGNDCLRPGLEVYGHWPIGNPPPWSPPPPRKVDP